MFHILIVDDEQRMRKLIKDFLVQKLHIPSLTIEVGSDELVHPIGEKYLDTIYERNKKNVIIVIQKKE